MLEINPILFSLSNGIRVAFVKNDAFVAHLGVMILAGSRFENEDEVGLAHFVEHCIFKGTEKRKAFDIYTELDSVGGELNAYTNKEELCVHASFRKNYLSVATELLGDIVQNSNFPIKEIEKEKKVVKDEIISYLDAPSERIHDDFESYLFKNNPLGNNILGTKKSLKSFTPEMLESYTSRLFFGENMVISVVGDFNESDLKKQLESDFGGLPKTGVAPKEIPVQKVKGFKKKEKKSNYQSHIVSGAYAPSYNDKRRSAMTLMVNYLGGPALNSRLALSLREKHGYAYNVEASYTAYSESGYWSIYVGTENKNIDKSVNLIAKELKLLRTKLIDPVALEHAKEQLKGHIALSLDSNLEVMFNLAKNILIFNRVDSVKEIYYQIDQITANDIQSLAQEVFAEELISSLIYIQD